MIEIVIPLSMIPRPILIGLILGVIGIICILISWKIFDSKDIIFLLFGVVLCCIGILTSAVYMINIVLLAMPPITPPNITFSIFFKVT